MAKKILLSLFLCAFVFCCTCQATSFAMTKEQTELKTRMDKLQSLMGMKRSDIHQKMKKPESTDAGDFICTYEKGLTTINFQPTKEGAKANNTDTVHYITALIPDSHQFTTSMLMEALGLGIPFNGQLLIQKEGCTFMASFDESGKCTKIDLAKM